MTTFDQRAAQRRARTDPPRRQLALPWRAILACLAILCGAFLPVIMLLGSADAIHLTAILLWPCTLLFAIANTRRERQWERALRYARVTVLRHALQLLGAAATSQSQSDDVPPSETQADP